MLYAERVGRQERGETRSAPQDLLMVGLAQCLALVPGVSRSGATMTAGLLLGFDRVRRRGCRSSWRSRRCRRGGCEPRRGRRLSTGVGGGPRWWHPRSFVVAYSSIAWLLRFVARHTYTVFIVYRIALGTLLLALLASGVVSAT